MARICVIGLWHLGCVVAACLAKRHNVTGYDLNPEVIDGLRAGRPPISEPGLPEAIAEAKSRGALEFTIDFAGAVARSDAIYVAIDTPVDKNDMVDVTPIEKAVGDALPFLRDGQLVIVSSQVPLGTCRRLQALIDASGRKTELCYTPENLSLGRAIHDYMNPGRIAFGVQGEGPKAMLEEVFRGIPGERIYMDLESAEMLKHAVNAYLALSISFSGEISNLCENTGANAMLVMGALRKEKKISPDAPVMPGLGFGGGTLARDLQVLRGIGAKKGIATPILDAAYGSNQERIGYVKRRLEGALGSLSGRTVAFFGLTYKPGTDTLRRSLSLDVIDTLSPLGVAVRAYDPAIKSQLGSHPSVKVCATPLEACSGADAIVIITAWEQFRELDYNALCAQMRQPVIIDARNIVPLGKLGSYIRYFGVGVTHG